MYSRTRGIGRHVLDMDKIDLKSLYTNMTLCASSSLGITRASLNHPVIKGSASECYWVNLLREYLPIKYGVDSGQVIDCTGNTSGQIDVIIYERDTFPYVFNNNGAFFIPIEAVVGVFEIKQDINKDEILYTAEKIESVRILEGSYLDDKGKEAERFWPPRPILGGFLSTDSSMKKDTLEKHLSQLKGLQTIDLGCCVNAYSVYVKYNTAEDERTNYKARSKPYVHTYEKDIALMVFVYQLIHQLQHNTKMTSSYSINIEAYLQEVNPDLVQTPISAPLF